MGREIKRVPMNFDWPLHKVWEGFQNPFYVAEECPRCKGTGLSPQAKHLHDQWYGYVPFLPSETGSMPLTPETPAVRKFAERQIQRHPEYYGSDENAIVRECLRLCNMWNTMWSHHLEQADVDALLENGRLMDFTREGVTPTVEQVNAWNIFSMGHDSINEWVCQNAKCQRLGYPVECEHCMGAGELWANEASKMLCEAWQNIEPPTGEGWQVWETVSEGSPISPVFATSDELAKWLVSQGYTDEASRAFIKLEWSPSMTMVNGEIKSAIECMSD